MTKPENHTQTLQGQTQINIVIAMMIKSGIPFAMNPIDVEGWRWEVMVPPDLKDYIQRFMIVAGEINLEEDNDDDQSKGG